MINSMYYLGNGVSVRLVKGALLRYLGELHVDLARENGDGVAAEAGDHHGAEVGDVGPLPEGGDAAPDAVSGLKHHHVHAEGFELE